MNTTEKNDFDFMEDIREDYNDFDYLELSVCLLDCHVYIQKRIDKVKKKYKYGDWVFKSITNELEKTAYRVINIISHININTRTISMFHKILNYFIECNILKYAYQRNDTKAIETFNSLYEKVRAEYEIWKRDIEDEFENDGKET